jgi:hypothetical protein
MASYKKRAAKLPLAIPASLEFYVRKAVNAAAGAGGKARTMSVQCNRHIDYFNGKLRPLLKKIEAAPVTEKKAAALLGEAVGVLLAMGCHHDQFIIGNNVEGAGVSDALVGVLRAVTLCLAKWDDARLAIDGAWRGTLQRFLVEKAQGVGPGRRDVL